MEIFQCHLYETIFVANQVIDSFLGLTTELGIEAARAL